LLVFACDERKLFVSETSTRTVFERITCAGPHDVLQRQMTERVLARHGSEAPADPERSLLMAFVTEATLAIYRRWVADGKRIAVDEVADIAVRLVCRGALARR